MQGVLHWSTRNGWTETPSGRMCRFRAAAAARTDIPDAGTATPRPDIRTDKLGDAINVPQNPNYLDLK